MDPVTTGSPGFAFKSHIQRQLPAILFPSQIFHTHTLRRQIFQTDIYHPIFRRDNVFIAAKPNLSGLVKVGLSTLLICKYNSTPAAIAWLIVKSFVCVSSMLSSVATITIKIFVTFRCTTARNDSKRACVRVFRNVIRKTVRLPPIQLCTLGTDVLR